MKNLLVAALILLSNLAIGQDMFKKHLYSADQIMEMRSQINLTDAQATKIKEIHRNNAGEFTTLKWDLDEENAKLQVLLEKSKIDHAAVENQLNRVLDLENQLKKKQLTTLVEIKNELSESQQIYLSSHQKHRATNLVRGVTSVGPQKTLSGTGTVRVGTRGPVLATSVNPSSEPSFSIQVNKDKADSEPLYFLETKSGMKKVLSFKTTDPNEIESIEVLKGEKAIEKFGKDAKNGAIIIRLKDMPE